MSSRAQASTSDELPSERHPHEDDPFLSRSASRFRLPHVWIDTIEPVYAPLFT